MKKNENKYNTTCNTMENTCTIQILFQCINDIHICIWKLLRINVIINKDMYNWIFELWKPL